MRLLIVHAQGAWRTGVRNRGVQALLLFALFVLSVSWVTASFSGRQPQTVALDIGISLVRLLGMLLAVFWVQELLVRDIERKATFWVLVYPVRRSVYLLGRSLGVFFLLMVYVSLMAGVLLLTLKLVGLNQYKQSLPVNLGVNYAIEFILVFIDLIVVASFAIFLAVQATVPTLPFFAGLGLAFAAHMVGPVQAYLASQGAGSGVVQYISQSLSWILPDLSRLDVRDWVLYGEGPSLSDVFWSTGQSVAYLAVLLLLSIWLFNKREFE